MNSLSSLSVQHTCAVAARVLERVISSSFILALLLACASSHVQAATIIRVKSDAVGPVQDGSSWSTAYKDLKSALNVAGAGTQIWVAAGTYRPSSTGSRTDSFIMRNGVSIYGGFAGTESAFSERNANVNVTTLSGDLAGNDTANFGNYGDNSIHILIASGVDASAILDGFVIKGGYANFPFGDPSGWGGAILATPTGSPTIRNCHFKANYAHWSGGAILCLNGNPQISHCSFIGNASPNNHGGGIYAGGANTKVTNCVFANNSGRNAPAVLFVSGAKTLANCTFFGNTGGLPALQNWGANASAINCIYWGNGTAIPSGFNFSYSNIQGGVAGTGNINVDPVFEDAASGNLRLKRNSPCLDAGDNSVVSEFITDLDGNYRLHQSVSALRVDMGAYEFGSSTPAPPVFTSAKSAAGLVGEPFKYEITVTGSQPISLSVGALPQGLQLAGATISGVPTAEGSQDVLLQASNPVSGPVQMPLRITIEDHRPKVTKVDPASGLAGSLGGRITIIGSNFQRLPTVAKWNGQDRPTSIVSDSELKMEVFATDVAEVGSAEITVASTGYGGGVSFASEFAIAFAKSADNSVTAAKLNDAVAGDGLAFDALKEALGVNPDRVTLDIADDQVRLMDGGVSTPKIANGAVVGGAIDAGGKISSGDMCLDRILVADGNQGTAWKHIGEIKLGTTDTSLNDELAALKSADDALRDALTNETLDRKHADATLQSTFTSQLDEERQARALADAAVADKLFKALNVETLERQAGDDAGAKARDAAFQKALAAVNDEAAVRAADDQAEAKLRDSADAKLSAALNAETQARIAGDEAEAQARNDGDANLTQALDTETKARVAGDSAEAKARADADTALAADIAAEANARKAADDAEATARKATDDGEAAARKAADDALIAALAAEVTARADAVAQLQAELASERALRKVGSSTTLAATDKTLIVTASATITLPNPNSVPPGKRYTIKNIGGGTVTIGGSVDGSAGGDLKKGEYLTILSDGGAWIKVEGSK